MKIFTIILTFFIAGCATEYGPIGLMGGYKSKVLTDGTIELTYLGHRSMLPDLVSQYWDRRAAELCQNGHIVIKKEDISKTFYYPSEFTNPAFTGLIKCK